MTRLYLLGSAPVDQDLEWNDNGPDAYGRILKRLGTLLDGRWRIDSVDYNPTELDERIIKLHRKRHLMIKCFTEAIDGIRFNTAITKAIELINDIYRLESEPPIPEQAHPVVAQCISNLIDCLAPFCPFISEDLNELMGRTESVHDRPWPPYDEAEIQEPIITIPVQINGKVRGQVKIPMDADEDQVLDAIYADEKLMPYLVSVQLTFSKYIPRKLISLVVEPLP
jgi:leucyl-tRNA synthetase